MLRILLAADRDKAGGVRVAAVENVGRDLDEAAQLGAAVSDPSDSGY